MFGADRYQVAAGDCVNLFWSVQNVQAVYFEGQGVAGESNWVVCPMQTTTYTLRVHKNDGSVEERTVTITTTATPSVSFWADKYEVALGECTGVHWSTNNVESVYYQGQGVPGQIVGRIGVLAKEVERLADHRVD